MNTQTKSTMAERLATATSTNTIQAEAVSKTQEAEKIASDGRMLRAQLASILGVAESELPAWYLNSNPHLVLRMTDTNNVMSNPVAQRDMRDAFDRAVAERKALEDADMSNEYQAYTLTDTQGHRSSIAVAHKQATSKDLPAVHTYKQMKGYLRLPLLAFKKAILTDWIDGIGRPCDLTITEETADVVFPNYPVKSTAASISVEELCESLDMCYWNRPQAVIVAVIVNGKTVKDAVAIPFDKLGTTNTTCFNCIVEQGDVVKYCSQTFRDDYDGRKAVNLIMNGEAPEFFNYHSELSHIFN